MKTVWLVWNNIGDSLKIYKFTLDEGDFDKVRSCHGLYINSSSVSLEKESNLNWLCKLVDNSEPVFDDTKSVNFTIPSGQESEIMVSGYL
jgi:hypothetical protein